MIQRIEIEKFKSIDHLVIEPAGNFNVFIGVMLHLPQEKRVVFRQ